MTDLLLIIQVLGERARARPVTIAAVAIIALAIAGVALIASRPA